MKKKGGGLKKSWIGGRWLERKSDGRKRSKSVRKRAKTVQIMDRRRFFVLGYYFLGPYINGVCEYFSQFGFFSAIFQATSIQPVFQFLRPPPPPRRGLCRPPSGKTFSSLALGSTEANSSNSEKSTFGEKYLHTPFDLFQISDTPLKSLSGGVVLPSYRALISNWIQK